MKRTATLLLGSLLVPLTACGPGRDNRIVIGSKNFTEQVILAELLAQHIEARTGLEVERKLNLGGTFICHQALRTGQLDLYVEYTGTALTAILKAGVVRDPEEAYRQVKESYARQFNVAWLAPLGFNDTFAIIVRGEDARRLNLTTITDVVPHAPQWRAGSGHEFMERADGYRGLVEAYGLRFERPPLTLQLGLLYRALKEGEVDIVAGNSTDGVIDALGLVILQDDRRYFPPYDAAPVVRRETLERFPQLRQALSELAGKISEEDMRRMNFAVDGEQRDVKEVVAEFLRRKGL
ncbi:MAG: glycine betaine ABC transporter substrate-binding protein [Terriglobia bacterium]